MNDTTRARFSSIPDALYWRSVFASRLRSVHDPYKATNNRNPSSHRQFLNICSTYLSRDCVGFTNKPRIVSPHSYISCLDIDSIEERFLLSGGGLGDCTICAYDTSLVGSDHYLHVGKEDKDQFHCIAQSKRLNPSVGRRRADTSRLGMEMNNSDDTERIRMGHSHTISQVKWYPVDSGIFLSSDIIGTILLWDANNFSPVSSLMENLRNTENASKLYSVSSIDLPAVNVASSHMLLAVACTCTRQGGQTPASDPGNLNTDNRRSFNGTNVAGGSFDHDRVVYLCDIKSGSTTHQLVGHAGVGGINSVQWSPTEEFILASGGNDGTIKLWDVRKSGSESCLTTFDREARCINENGMNAYNNAYNRQQTHAEVDCDDEVADTAHNTRRKRARIAPNDFSSTAECSSRVQSHIGPVSSIRFTPDGKSLVSIGLSDRQLQVWSLQSTAACGSPCLSPVTFLGPPSAHSSVLSYPIGKSQSKSNMPLTIMQPGSSRSATAWIGSQSDSGDSMLLGYEVHGMGGHPQVINYGHIDQVSSIVCNNRDLRVFSGGADGMILAWGKQV